MSFFRRFSRGRDEATPVRALGSVAAVLTAAVVVLVVVFYAIQALT
ncbi:MAG: hypothetical protein H0V40_01925 [Actinobacteria bacterium]|nr:hypothetical protein [Actinomycetota bacterium]